MLRAMDRSIAFSKHPPRRFEPDSRPRLLYPGPANAEVLNCEYGSSEQPLPGSPTTLMRAAVVCRLGEIPLALQQRRHAEAVDGAAGLPRTIFVAVEEEPPVVSTRFPDRPSEGVAPILLLRNGFWIPVLGVHPAVRVPIGVPLDVVDRSAVLVVPLLVTPVICRPMLRPYSAW